MARPDPLTAEVLTSQPRVEGVSHRLVDTGEVRLHAAETAGAGLVVLLHGFPEFWWSWRHQLTALAAAGLRGVAPDLRGYNLSDQPEGVASYAAPRLAADVAGLIAALGAGRATVVGHDWGGIVAWELASRYPEKVERLAILNSPHPVAFRRALLSPRQLLRSSYMAAIQVPGLAERLLMAADGALLRSVVCGLRARPVPRGELDAYVAAARRARSLRGGLDYYRAAVRAPSPRAGDPPRRRGPVGVPVLVIWGERDPALLPALARPPRAFAPDARVELLPAASHDVQLDEPERVSRLLVEFASGR